MAVDKNKVIAGRKAVEDYRTAHDVLHTGTLAADILEQRHTELLDTLTSQLKALGFVSLEDYEKADVELRFQDYNSELRTMSLPAGGPMRFVDVSSLGFEELWALRVGSKDLRLSDAIPDTIYFGHPPVSAAPVVAYANSPAGDEVASRAASLGIKTCRSRHQHVRHAGYIWQHDLSLRVITKGRFANLDEARKASYALCVQALVSLGIQDVVIAPNSNNFKLGEKKVASACWASYDGVFSIATPVTLDFNFDLGEQVFADSTIRERVTTLKNTLGHATTAQTVRDAILAAVGPVFNSAVTAGELSQAELDAISEAKHGD